LLVVARGQQRPAAGGCPLAGKVGSVRPQLLVPIEFGLDACSSTWPARLGVRQAGCVTKRVAISRSCPVPARDGRACGAGRGLTTVARRHTRIRHGWTSHDLGTNNYMSTPM